MDHRESTADDSRCRLCGAATSPLSVSRKPFKRYEVCRSCAYVQVARPDLPGFAEARERYLLHRNDASDTGYASWLAAFADAAIRPWVAPGAEILDFGSGPEPALSTLLERLGYRAYPWDPHFAPVLDWKARSFDAVVLHEVFEHLDEPARDLAACVDSVRPGGVLCIRSALFPERPEAFDAWWYRSDATHVGFLGLESIAWIAARFGLETLLARRPDLAVFRRA